MTLAGAAVLYLAVALHSAETLKVRAARRGGWWCALPCGGEHDARDGGPLERRQALVQEAPAGERAEGGFAAHQHAEGRASAGASSHTSRASRAVRSTAARRRTRPAECAGREAPCPPELCRGGRSRRRRSPCRARRSRRRAGRPPSGRRRCKAPSSAPAASAKAMPGHRHRGVAALSGNRASNPSAARATQTKSSARCEAAIATASGPLNSSATAIPSGMRASAE